jgi:O-antigen/teichoic acid export membrane protein
MSVNRRIFSGALWMISARWGIRGIGLISTIVLVRLLTPADFGVVALAMLVVGLVEVFGETGLVLYLIRHPDPQRGHFDTVWTLRIIIGAMLAALIFLAAPLGSQFFSEPAIEAPIRWLALRPLILGLENPGIIWFRKEMTFRRDFEFLVANRIVSFFITVALAFWLKSYWALVIGILAAGLVSLIQSYRMHPYRPRLCLAYTHEVWRFSSWLLLQHLLTFMNERLDGLLIGRFSSTTELGYYTVATDVAASPVREVIIPMSRVLFPGFVKLAEDPEALAQSFIKVFSGVAILAFSVGTGIALIAHDFTYLFLGQKWTEAIPLLRILALSAGAFALFQPVLSFLSAIGSVRAAASLSLLRLLFLASLITPAALYYGLEIVALGRLVAMSMTSIVAILLFTKLSGVLLTAISTALIRPVAASIVMAVAVISIIHVSPNEPLLRLALSILIGALSFGGTLMGLWRLQGRPASIEADLIGLVSRRFKKWQQYR